MNRSEVKPIDNKSQSYYHNTLKNTMGSSKSFKAKKKIDLTFS